MYIVNKDTKETSKIDETTFKTYGLKERKDIQEWIANNPSILGEELLIIQKEFDGFNNTNERLDLLALDKEGNIVVIENKLDDSGKDVVWQAMKYAGYCSSLKKENVKDIYSQYLNKNGIDEDAETKIAEFLDKEDFSEVQLNSDLKQRIILVAREFRREVTNTVIWARKYGIKIQCIKIKPYIINSTFVIDTDQIIPTKDIADIMINYDEKAHEDMINKEKQNNAMQVRNKFWNKLLPLFNKKSELFSGRSLDANKTDHWLSTGAGISGVSFSLLATKSYAAVELDITTPDKASNKKIFNYLYQYKDEINLAFEKNLIWEKLDNKKASKLYYKLDDVSIFNEEDWDKMISFLIDNMIKLESVLRKYINNYTKTKNRTN